MRKHAMEITKTLRILSLYHLLTHCAEVSFKEMDSLLCVCKKTFQRDIAILKYAGVNVCYSAKRKAYVLNNPPHNPPVFSGNKSEIRFIKKIHRLIIFIDDAPDTDCDIWYESIIGCSKRTMQRDFAILNAIGYQVKYERESWNMHDAGTDVALNHYYFDRPETTYSIKTFREADSFGG